jgi:hypothetical protein
MAVPSLGLWSGIFAVRARLTLIPIKPLIAILTGAPAFLMLGVVWRAADPASALTPRLAVLGGVLVVVTVAQYKFPVHIWQGVKTYIGSIPLYLLVVLLPPGLAAPACALGVLGGNLLVRRQHSNPPSYIAADGTRWIFIALAGSLATGALGGPTAHYGLPLVLTGAVLFLGDVTTAPLLLCPITREPPARVVMMLVREAGPVEAALYIVALLAAVAALHQAWTLALIVVPAGLIYVAFKNMKEMHNETRRVLESMADAVDLRDPYTGGHSRRVTELTRAILAELATMGAEADLIVSAARVHDIGKIGIPDAILNKAGPFTADERGVMETHPERGAELLERYKDFARGADIVRYHHEAWDGSGYPAGIAGTDIPFGARVIAVADSFDAMTSDRPYRKALSTGQACEILRSGRGRQWDAVIVEAFLSYLAKQAEGVEALAASLPAALEKSA